MTIAPQPLTATPPAVIAAMRESVNRVGLTIGPELWKAGKTTNSKKANTPVTGLDWMHG